MKDESLRVLIVEDDPAYVRLTNELLKENSRVKFELIHVKRFNDALKRINSEAFDAVLLDLNLPDSSGISTFERLYAQSPHMPIIVLTSLEDDELGVITVQKGAQDYLSKGQVDGNLLACSIQYALERKRSEEALKQSREQLRNLSAHLQTVREEERANIAREIHDELGQILTALKMDLSWILKKYSDHKSIFEKTESMSGIVDATIKSVKRICTELRPQVLDDLGLTAAIEWQAEEFKKRSGIACEVDFNPEEIVLDKERSIAIFRIFQETLTNIARHANATAINVRMEKKDSGLLLVVRDNGKGVTEKQILDPNSFGLIGMRERVIFLGGDFQIGGSPNNGTTVTVNIPLMEKAND